MEQSPSFPILITKRLTLRQLGMNDAEEIFLLRSDREINKYLDRQLSHTIVDAGSFIQKILENKALYWAIALPGNNRLVGTVCLYGFSEENDQCEIGFELLPNFQGQGIMKEAVEKVIEYAFRTIKVRKMDAFVQRQNQKSIKLLEKLLFIHSNKPDETHADLWCYQLTNSNDHLF